jgi:hypothetical protein
MRSFLGHTQCDGTTTALPGDFCAMDTRSAEQVSGVQQRTGRHRQLEHMQASSRLLP